jgi:hypothetical protein
MPTLDYYTTPDEVRAALGVSSTEISNAVLALPMYPVLLTGDLEEVYTGISAGYDVVHAIAENTRTAAQAKFHDTVRVWAAFDMGARLMRALPMFGVQELTDGKAEFKRFDLNWQQLADDIDATLVALKFRLIASFTTMTGVEVPVRTFNTNILSTGLGVDPVTNA